MSILARLRGRVEQKRPDGVIVFVGGLGFEVQVPLSTLAALPEAGEEVTLRTYLYIREGTLGLYGFLSEGEQRLFELLLTVGGVGPKAALNCLGHLSPEQLAGAIAQGDATSLQRVPGVGRKMADRMIVELKGRLKDLPQEAYSSAAPGAGSVIIEALMFYGHTAAEAAAAIANLPKDRELSEEDQILLALQYFAPK